MNWQLDVWLMLMITAMSSIIMIENENDDSKFDRFDFVVLEMKFTFIELALILFTVNCLINVYLGPFG